MKNIELKLENGVLPFVNIPGYVSRITRKSETFLFNEIINYVTLINMNSFHQFLISICSFLFSVCLLTISLAWIKVAALQKHNIGKEQNKIHKLFN